MQTLLWHWATIDMRTKLPRDVTAVNDRCSVKADANT